MIQTKKRCRRGTAAILLAGLAASVIIYFTAGEPVDDPFSEFENSKRFTHEIEQMGGKLALVAHELSKWFAQLWQGKQLAFTVAVITIVVAAVYYLITSRNPVDHR